MQQAILLIVMLLISNLALANTAMIIKNDSDANITVSYAICKPKTQVGVIRVTERIYAYTCNQPVEKIIYSNNSESISVPDDQHLENGARIHYLLRVASAKQTAESPTTLKDCIADTDNDSNTILLSIQSRTIICKSAKMDINAK